MCRSAVVRVKSLDQDVLQKGEVVGFVRSYDIQFQNDTTGSLYCFVEPVDELIEGGWSVVQVQEKHLHNVDEEEEQLNEN